MAYRLVITPQARSQLRSIYSYIADAASPHVARGFTDGIIDSLTTLTEHPLIGAPRDDLRPGLRTLAHRRRAVIAFVVEGAAVVVVGVYYGGQDFETLLREG